MRRRDPTPLPAARQTAARGPDMTIAPATPITPGRIMQFTFGFAPPLIIEAAIRHLGAPPSPARSHSLDELAADFPAGVSGSVDIDIPAPSHEVGGLGVGQIGRIFERARARRNRHGDAGVLAGFRRPVE